MRALLAVPIDSAFLFDYSVESGKSVLITLLTKDQIEQLTNHKPLQGDLQMKVIASGIGTQSARIPKGEYFITLYNMGATPTRVTYRASYRQMVNE